MSQHDQQQAVLQKVRAVSFDLDDTFWDCAPVIARAEKTLMAWIEANHPRALEPHTPESIGVMRNEMYETHKHLRTDVTLMRKALLTKLFSDYQVNENEAVDALKNEHIVKHIVEQAFDIFYRARSEVVLYEGTREMLRALKTQYKLATITNGNADLQQIGLAEYFEDMRSADLQNPPKPAVDMFQACCETLNIAANELLHVGDNPHTDVLGGHNAGVLTVWFNQAKQAWPSDVPPASFEVGSIAELKQLLMGVSV